MNKWWAGKWDDDEEDDDGGGDGDDNHDNDGDGYADDDVQLSSVCLGRCSFTCQSPIS